jgi:ABC-type transport system involved in multi-copper enzyme maturation permease subunit
LSVYKHEYRAYTGALTPLRARIGVVARYAWDEAWSSRVTPGLLVLTMLPAIVYMVGIYLANNSLARTLIMHGNNAVAINAAYFYRVLQTQCWLALVMTAWIAPRLVSFDLADNALPIILSHPISRFGYLLGKFITLFESLSLVTWIPCLFLFAYQGYSAPTPWMFANLQIAVGLLAGSLVWIVLLSIVGLALSAWVRWRVLATGIIFAAVFVPAGLGGIITAILRTKWGFLLNLPFMMSELWQHLLGAPVTTPRPERLLPVTAIVIMLLLMCGVCVLMLNARIRGREVVRG